MRAFLDAPLPYPEAEALAETPVLWQLGPITLRVPLFSFHKLKRFNQLAGLLKVTPPQEIPLSLLNLMTQGQTGGDMASLKTTLTHWQADPTLGGFDIDTLAALLLSVSDPVDPESAAENLRAWGQENGVDLDVPNDPRRQPQAMRQALATLAQHELSVSDAVALIEKLVEVNARTEKKRRGENGARREVSPRKALWSQLVSGGSG